MKKTITHILVIFSLFLTSCKSPSTFVSTSIVLDDKDMNYVSMSDIFECEKFVFLDSSAVCQISNIKRIIPYKNQYYILDNDIHKCILIYDENGNFIRKIGNVGKGKTEYQTVEDFTIEENSGNIIVLSSNSTLYIYKADGSFVDKKKIDESVFWNIAYNNNRYIFTTNNLTFTKGDNAFLIYTYDLNFNLLSKDISVLPMQMYMLSPLGTNIKTLRNFTIYTDIYEKKVYVIDENMNIKECFEYQMSNPIPYEDLSNTQKFIQTQQKYDYLLENVFLAKNIVTFYSKEGEARLSVVNNEGKIIKDSKYAGIIPKIFWTDGNTILCAMPYEDYEYMRNQNSELFFKQGNYVLYKMKLKLRH